MSDSTQNAKILSLIPAVLAGVSKFLERYEVELSESLSQRVMHAGTFRSDTKTGEIWIAKTSSDSLEIRLSVPGEFSCTTRLTTLGGSPQKALT
jgi:hypothetical protein